MNNSGLINELLLYGIEVIYYEPLINETLDLGNAIRVDSIDELAKRSNIIIANGVDSEIKPYLYKVYSRDLNQVTE